MSLKINKIKIEIQTHFDDTVFLGSRIESILYITFANNSQVPNDIDGRRSQHVVIRVRERLRRRHNDGIASVNTQGIKILEDCKPYVSTCRRRGLRTSILQTVMQLSRQSRTTSYSISFHPFILFSTNTCGLVAKALLQSALNCASSCAKPDPSPPNAYAARTMTGNPIVCAAAMASSCVVAVLDCAHFSPISSIA